MKVNGKTVRATRIQGTKIRLVIVPAQPAETLKALKPIVPNLTDTRDVVELALTSTVTAHGNSAVSEWLRCPTAHALRTQGIYGKVSPDWSQIGTLVHSGLAIEGMAALTGIDAQWQDMFDSPAIRQRYSIENIAESNRLLRAYETEYDLEICAGYGSEYKLIAIEHFLSSDHFGTEPYTARVDTLLQHRPTSALVVVDTKTRASMPRIPDAELAAKLVTRPQFLGLAFLIRETFGQLPIVMVNFISKTAIPNFRRVPFAIAPQLVDAWAENHAAALVVKQAMTGKSKSLPVYKNFNECAPDIGTPCWAFGWCHGDDKTRAEEYNCPSKQVQKKRKQEKANHAGQEHDTKARRS